jgi:hypothetical protein
LTQQHLLRTRAQDAGREQQLELDSARSRLVAAAAEAEGLTRELARRPEPRVLEGLQRQVASMQVRCLRAWERGPRQAPSHSWSWSRPGGLVAWRPGWGWLAAGEGPAVMLCCSGAC